MSTAMSKRQQARNEQALQDLVRNVPGNNMCADCHALNPAWASWSLGVFLCMRCAAIHRKLGTHISKVKSLSMDSWANEQVENMRKVGNVASNNIYNPDSKKPPVPVDADEADSAMERFIRAKYMNNVAVKKSAMPKSPRLDEGTPPPLPPKNSTKFGFRSASSIFPLSSRAKKETKSSSMSEFDRSAAPLPTNKPAKVFGASFDYDNADDIEKKLVRLNEMGFFDKQRNTIILKGVNGNLDRAIETLVRLGDNDRRSPTTQEQPRERALRPSKSLTPLTQGTSGLGAGMGVPQKAGQTQPNTPSSVSTNPFDAMGPAQPQTAQSTGTLQNKNPYGGSTNPFGAPAQQVDLISQAFQGLSVAPQPLFPHHTGGMASQQPMQQPMQQYMQPAYQQMPSLSSASSSPQVYQQAGFQNNAIYGQQPLQAQPTGYNPFLTNHPAANGSQHLSLNTAPAQSPSMGGNPFIRSPTRIASPTLGQIPEQFQTTSFQSPGLFATPVSGTPATATPMSGTNPFFSPPSQPAMMGQQSFGQPAPMQPQYQYQPQRPDTASIMALYGQPPASPQQATSPSAVQPTQTIDQFFQPQSLNVAAPMPGLPTRSVTMPVGTGNNPFMSSGTGAAGSDPFATNRKVSRESMNLGLEMAWTTNGRHSPDAFASLSARHV
ncbi:hypothetical protein B0I35DRAFT_405254 [Stachybotrys elegans]|uniref:Arf-GAP domain-containing protein n=1 Tax=Stachybotrys elegans TaxID=80388 RepID=A0A8K0WWJ0_9HYPO|nr:hypothetical protein B0I35DRAFT_405254 [Stachybotrys elegans]